MSTPTHFFSIIVPVYNDEDNLRRCINSILFQTFEDFECIIINDGSTDNCPDICDDYANKDKRIRVFHKENEGISKTRQFGIDHAESDYIFFIDSDDWIEFVFLENIYISLKDHKADILFLDFFEEIAAGKERYVNQKPFILETETVMHQILEGSIFSCLWNVVIKRNLYVYKRIKFTEKINYGEDTLFIIELLLNNPNTDYLPNAYYHHTYNHSSYTRKDKKNKYLDRIIFLKQLSILLNNYKRNDLNKHNFFPMNDKYEMLCSGEFSKKEYQFILPLSFSFYYLKQSGIYKYLLLITAETFFYSLAKFFAVYFRYIKRRLS